MGPRSEGVAKDYLRPPLPLLVWSFVFWMPVSIYHSYLVCVYVWGALSLGPLLFEPKAISALWSMNFGQVRYTHTPVCEVQSAQTLVTNYTWYYMNSL